MFPSTEPFQTIVTTAYDCPTCSKRFLQRYATAHSRNKDCRDSNMVERRVEMTCRVLDDADADDADAPSSSRNTPQTNDAPQIQTTNALGISLRVPIPALPNGPQIVPFGSDEERDVVRRAWCSFGVATYGRTMEPSNAFRVLFKVIHPRLRNASPAGGRSKAFVVTMPGGGAKTMQPKQYAQTMGERMIVLLRELIRDATEHPYRVPDLRVETVKWAHDFKRVFFRDDYDRSGYSFGDLVHMACVKKRTYWNVASADTRETVANCLQDIIDIVMA